MRELHEEFALTNGHEPKFAYCSILFNDENIAFSALIKLRDFDPVDTENDQDDGNVTYFSNGIDGLCKINTDKTADFTIVEIFGFLDDI